jgi:GMP synthase-like glutamine amidotransferase
MKTLRIHYLQHVPFEGLGYIETWASEYAHILTATKFYEKTIFPELSDFDCLIVMGGPMGVYDEDNFQWLKEEKMFIKKAIKAGKKVVGICLGAQLIAACLGAKVVAAENKEIGWFPVFPTEECKSPTWFYELFKDNPIVFHWHGDQFEIPNNCSNLLVSEANTNQAFCYGENVIGLQFHLEVTEQTTALMLNNGVNELTKSPFIQAISDIQLGKQHIGHCNKIMKAVLEKLKE